MPDSRATSEFIRDHASRTRRRDAALVAEYIHDLSDRHNGSAQAVPATSDGKPVGDGGRRDEGG
jgi:hypothetical protein